jgi:hypothetical protein
MRRCSLTELAQLWPRCDCGETRSSALQFNPRDYKGQDVFYGVACGNCVALDRKSHPVGRCVKCENPAPIEKDHVYGRAVSDDLQDLCINCHRCKSRRDADALKLRRFRKRFDASYAGERK